MPSTFRIPKAEIAGPYARAGAVLSRKAFGEVPDVAYVMLHHKPSSRPTPRSCARSRSGDRLDGNLKSYAVMAAAATVGCGWMVEKITDQLGVEALVERTMMVAVENQRARFNAAMGLASQGHADSCALAPLAR